MSNEDREIFADAFKLFDKYRSIEMKEDDWKRFVKDVGMFAEKHKWQENPLAHRIGMALIDTFDDLYKAGKKPEIPDYFGREDL